MPLPIPAVKKPARTVHGVDEYEVTQRIGSAEILPGKTTKVWGFDGTFPGPTFEARAGHELRVKVRNELPQPTSTHLHGGVTPPDSDGYPTDLVVPVDAVVHGDDTLRKAADVMVDTGHGVLPVVSADGALLGLISQFDLLRAHERTLVEERHRESPLRPRWSWRAGGAASAEHADLATETARTAGAS